MEEFFKFTQADPLIWMLLGGVFTEIPITITAILIYAWWHLRQSTKERAKEIKIAADNYWNKTVYSKKNNRYVSK